MRGTQHAPTEKEGGKEEMGLPAQWDAVWRGLPRGSAFLVSNEGLCKRKTL